MLTVESMLDVSVVRVNIVQNSICIGLMACCKNNDLEVLTCFFKTLKDVRPYIYSSTDHVLRVRLSASLWGEVNV